MNPRTVLLVGLGLAASLASTACSHRAPGNHPPLQASNRTPGHIAAVPVGPPPVFRAHGLYATGWSAGLPKKLDSLIATIHKCGLNSIVIDVKDSDGCVSYYTPDVPLAVEIGACFKQLRKNRCADIQAALKKLKDAHVHTIARIVCFDDPILARKRTDLAIKSVKGGLWKDRRGKSWVDPTRREVWQYDVDLAKDAVRQGFDEIQWDYVRFPSDGNTHLCSYSEPVDHDRAWLVIANYLKFARQQLAPLNVPVSADIFGLTGTAKTDMGIGQKISPIADNVDIISPMVYPSHFAHGEYRMPNPNAQPYRTIFLSLRDARKRLVDSQVIIRPWLQAFTLGSPPYGPSQVLDQLRGVRDNHLSQFLWWNASNHYDMLESALTSQAGKTILADIRSNPDHPTPDAASAPAARPTSTVPKAKH